MTSNEKNLGKEHLSSWQRAVLAAAYVERILPIIERFGSPQTVEFFRQVSNDLWERATDEEVDISELTGRANELPEADVDDSYDPRFYAMLGIGIAVYALQFAAGEKNESGEWLSNAALELRSNLDAALEGGGSVEVMDADAAQTLGRLESREEEQQAFVLRMVGESSTPPTRLIESVRLAARDAASELDRAIAALPSVDDTRSG